MTTPVTPSDVRARAKKLFDRDARTWAAEQQTGVVLDVPLRPPTEREALSDLNRVREWVKSWRGVSLGNRARVGRPKLVTRRITGGPRTRHRA